MKKIAFVALAGMLLITMSSCFIFKKKCDCPKFGKVKNAHTTPTSKG